MTKYRIQELVSPEEKRPLFRIQERRLGFLWWAEWYTDYQTRFTTYEDAKTVLDRLETYRKPEVWKDV